MSISCPACGDYRHSSEDVCEKCGYNFVTQKTKDGRSFDKIVPNNAKSLEGVWYPFEAKFKIEEAKSDTDEHSQRHKPYVLYITFPDDVRTGMYPRDFRLATQDGKSTSYYYNGYNEDKAGVKHLHQRIKDLTRFNRTLIQRNQALEKHFSQTYFEKQLQEDKARRTRFECGHCGDPIDTKILVEGRDYILTEDDGLHLKCTPKVFNSICHNCNLAYSDEGDDGHCEECGGDLDNAEEKEILEFFTFDAIKKHLPEELRDKVVLKPSTDISSKEESKHE